MRQHILIGVVLLFVFVTCRQNPTSPTITYQGTPLPTPQDKPGCEQACPPAAWLVTDDGIIEASYGAFTTAMHTDPAPTLLKEEIAAGRLHLGSQAVIVVASTSVSTFDAREQSWNQDPLPYTATSGRLLASTSTRAPSTTVFTLEQADDPGEQLVHVTITFPVKPAPAIGTTGIATYFWRVTVAQER
jgi:hypothetical protein